MTGGLSKAGFVVITYTWILLNNEKKIIAKFMVSDRALLFPHEAKVVNFSVENVACSLRDSIASVAVTMLVAPAKVTGMLNRCFSRHERPIGESRFSNMKEK